MKWTFGSLNCALMVVDMQNDFVQEGAIMEVPQARIQVPKIARLLQVCRYKAMPIIYTVHVTDSELCALEVAHWPHLKEKGMRMGTDGVQIVQQLQPQKKDTVIYKHRFSAFYNTNLDIVLRAKNIHTLIICGTLTNICCESTARDAFFRDYRVVFGSDICSALSDDIQRATLYNMEIFGRVLDCDSIIRSIT